MRILSAFFTLCVFATLSNALNTQTHALSIYGNPKYPKNFTHFDYVNPNAPKGGTLKSFALGTFDSLNPFSQKGNPAAELHTLVYNTLTIQSLDEPFSEYALVADSMTQGRDFIIFHLNKKARFSDGKPIRAKDVVFSFETLLQKGKIDFKRYYADVNSVKALSDLEVIFYFKTDSNKELPLILGQIPILPSHIYLQNGKNTFGENPLQIPVGSGAYKVKKFDLGRSITYERDPNYWAKDHPTQKGMYNFDEVVVEYYKDPAVAQTAFMAGEYDYRIETSAKVWANDYEGRAKREGKIILQSFRHELPSTLQGFFFNTRKPIFADKRVREAIFYAFDFEWSNKNLFYNQYERTTHIFHNSPFASSALPQGKELEILLPYKDRLDSRIFTQPYIVPITNGEQKRGENLRENLKYARDLLESAGFYVKNGALYTPTHQPFSFEILISYDAFERICLPFAKNLKKLGIEAKIRKVDDSQYINRVRAFEYDMVVELLGQSLFPGNEQNYYWNSQVVSTKGSKNFAGVQDPVVDELITKLLNANSQQDRIAIGKSLDRVLLWGFYVLPHFNLPAFRIAYWRNIAMPSQTPPYGIDPYLWWSKGAKS
ncbi:ABC transporter substrate-binding protein [Helicobacter cinaedi PAGU611]|uniref:ABC transporter substrate-binding protein n=1 Tax=Helicobacter cinaedi CCUG 18818 = ATCC BAA-847 TaxID=537971 RepID=A0AAI8MNM1_9HELI|nr:extracellular solute-binding protein [Helicobacter cinaedi]AWK62121.1 ABC transporter substrate-binding protein [Helicobacter cinaedi]QOQ91134.1 ABC transporter substrate-binding protein [Helicobacter cinaedi]QOQ95328.1 ABC transporter substrate-binding protein [Helicobacter cinaedi]BAM12688.1 ABC transporter substrate-binding protein [Helicobacter cinaedi PAGU611]BAM32934.1 ABC transporter substrate-binding protein [Helicobacter cinaedi CCUG 18818 = ATCC BAA-847]